MDSNSLMRRLEMYAMINAIENDLVEILSSKLTVGDIPTETIKKCQNVSDTTILTAVLRGLDLQGYIEIINSNIFKLGVTTEQKNFINSDFNKIISIRNKVMHPRLFGFFDYPMLKACFSDLPIKLSCFNWNNVTNTKRLIEEEPSYLMQFETNFKKSNKTLENLPTVVDFEDTSFIGRAREIGEIKEKLFKKNVHILTIMGDGGVGKTATTIKLLYDLLDDEKNPFELILWVSLKTKELNNYEFTEIHNSIRDIEKMYQKLESATGGSLTDEVEIQKDLISISKQFRTLLVLDNLETLNTSDIRDFLIEFSEEGKVLITSRIGLGELELRYPLRGLSDSDLALYTDTLFKLYNIDNFFSDKEKMSYVKNDLHANPLAIKWFARGLANGQTAQQLLNHKQDLISFCMSNVYDKLSNKAKEILLVLKTAHAELSFAEMFFLIDRDATAEAEVRGAVNELCKCNFIDADVFRLSNILSITDFAFEFIREYVEDNSEVEGQVKHDIKELHAFNQSMLEKQANSPYSLGTFHYNFQEKEKGVAAYYLNKAVDAFNKSNEILAFKYVEIAKSLCPKYFECNKIAAYFLKNTDPQKALIEYDIAKKNSESDEELRLVYIGQKEFCIANADYMGALDILDKAISIRDEFILQIEKSKILGFLGRFDDSIALLDSIESQYVQNPKFESVYYNRRADIFRRKSETYRDYNERFKWLKMAYETLCKSTFSKQSDLNVLSNIVKDLVYISFDLEAAKYVYEILKNSNNDIFKMSGIRDLRKKINVIIPNIANFPQREELILMLFDYDAVSYTLSGNKGVVYHINGNFGFIKNSNYPRGIFFLLKDAFYDVRLGDIVTWDKTLTTEKGDMVKDIKLIQRASF